MENNLVNHPQSLSVFFATEMWERYGFYVVQSLLALYLALELEWDDDLIYSLVGSFTALTYLSPVIGGWVADHLIGQKKAILTGTIILFFSYLSLFLLKSDDGLLSALSGIAVGTGLLKPNISSLLGNEYAADSAQRESGFTIFYMGITTGIILGTTLPSQINYYLGWSGAFISAAIGLVIAFSIFAFGIKRYKIADYSVHQLTIGKTLKAITLMILLWIASFYILHYTSLANFAFSIVVILSLTYLIYSTQQETGIQVKKNIVIGLLCIISIMFWTFYFQMFLSLTLLISRIVEPKLFGVIFPPPYYVSIQSIGMVIFGCFLSRIKYQLNIQQNGIRAANKFMLAMIFTTIAYGFITVICKIGSNVITLLSPLYFIPAYLMLSIAELLLSPVGLSIITLLAGRAQVSTMMGIFFVSLGIGAFLSGKLASLTAINAATVSIVELKVHYATSFSKILLLSIAATGMCLTLNLAIKKLLK